jgi:hypothetical protein
LRRRIRQPMTMRRVAGVSSTLYHGLKAVFSSGNLSITLGSLKTYVGFAACQIEDFNFFGKEISR